MKKRVFIIILILFSFLIVNANIICNDGSVSKSCRTCHKGCCSKHGGCSNNIQRIPRNNYTEPKESIPNNNVIQKTPKKEEKLANNNEVELKIGNENLDSQTNDFNDINISENNKQLSKKLQLLIQVLIRMINLIKIIKL